MGVRLREMRRLGADRRTMNAMRRTVLRRPASMCYAPRLAALQLHPRFPRQQLLQVQQPAQLLRPAYASGSRAFSNDPGSAAQRIQTKLAAHFAVRWTPARSMFSCCDRDWQHVVTLLLRVPQDGTVEVEDVSGAKDIATTTH